jgi:DNA-binding GntR family transcriptional regulator
LSNRFAFSLNDVVSLVFHYHYQWDKGEEKPRIEHAVQEHLVLLRALARRDRAGAVAAMNKHLDSARRTMLDAVLHRSPGSAPH